MDVKPRTKLCRRHHACSLVVQVLADGYQATKDGLIFKDFEEGQGPMPSDGQVSVLAVRQEVSGSRRCFIDAP